MEALEMEKGPMGVPRTSRQWLYYSIRRRYGNPEMSDDEAERLWQEEVMPRVIEEEFGSVEAAEEHFENAAQVREEQIEDLKALDERLRSRSR